ncbi:MAG: DNA (cytosine-5-)-methyltransferase [Lachnospiraceae bacterium]|jgi:DNA (cytosine-5)-methyltransferase 1|nr:DNA (cytosine-5-)-methyltransferase [Lachnospiraceae bacterium]
MRPKTGLPKRKALRNNPVFECGLRDNWKNRDIAHPNMVGQQYHNGFSVMSMFCGCGGLDLGFLGGFKYLGDEYKALPFNIVKAVDIDERSIQTYNLNISPHGEVGDLSILDSSELPSARILIGGFPCQDFSSSGPKVGFAGERGQLYLSMIAYMRTHKPDIVIGENVPYLATLHGGKYLRQILKDIKTAGYNAIVWELFAPLYGLSQSRKRLIIVAVRKDLGFPPDAPKPKLASSYLPIEHAIGDLEDVTDESVPNQSQYFVATRATSGGGQGDHKNKRGALAYCIRANAKARIQFHYSLDRRLTVRECARLQSFPDEFVFPFSAMSNMTQIGNAVPPILGYAIATTIADYLEKLDSGEKILDNKNAYNYFEQINFLQEAQ